MRVRRASECSSARAMRALVAERRSARVEVRGGGKRERDLSEVVVVVAGAVVAMVVARAVAVAGAGVVAVAAADDGDDVAASEAEEVQVTADSIIAEKVLVLAAGASS